MSLVPSPTTQASVSRKIARLLIADYTMQEIAQVLQITAQTVNLYVKSPMFQAILTVEKQALRERLAENVGEALEALEPAAVEAYRRGLQESEPSAYLRAADAILDRSHHPKKTQQDIVHSINISIDATEKAAIEVACEEAGVPLVPAKAPLTSSGLKHIDDVLAEPE